MAKTIKEIAEEIGVSKSAIHQRRKKEPLKSSLQCFTESVDGKLYVDDKGVELIKQVFSRVSEEETVKNRQALTDNFTVSTVNDREVLHGMLHTLQGELGIKNRQIEALQKSVNDLTKALEHAQDSLNKSQALHAGTIQSQLEAQSQNTTTEPPETPSEGSSGESKVEAREEMKNRPAGFWGRLFQK